MKFLHNRIGLFFLTFIVFFLAIVNYQTGTYLTGWDNLQTELAPWVGVKRALFAVWQEYQSFGLLAGMAHGADIVRSILVWILSLILPQSLIRYTLTFTLILIGTLGMARLLKLSGLTKEKYPFAIIGALFYLLNYATIQILFLPYESYVFLYAFLPWEVWIFLKIISLKDIKRNNWFLFLLINFAATSQAVAQQLFVVYGLVLSFLSLGILFIHQNKLLMIKRSVIAALLIFIINSFWLLPQIYFLRTSDEVVTESKMNQLATENVFYQNLEKGTVKDFTTLTGFFNELTAKNGDLLFKEWRTYREDMIFPLIIFFAFLPFIGMLKRSTYQIPFLLLYLLTAVALLSNTPFFNYVNELLRSNSLINQIFRSPFTKFVVPYSLVVSFFVAYGFLAITDFIPKIKIKTQIIYMVGSILILLYSLPAFLGFYISPEMKVKLPQEYKDVIQYFQNVDKNKRIALFPDYTYWGWFFHNWGYNGSGFLWYGVEQPMISRTFDVWSFPSESYYWEIKYAVEAEDVRKTEDVLRKYNISYLLLDYSLEPVASAYQSLQYDRTENIFSQSDRIKLVTKNQYFALYEFTETANINNFISLSSPLINAGPKVNIMHKDMIYQTYGDYKTDGTQLIDLYVPFLDMMSQTRIKDQQWNILEDKNTIIFDTQLPFNPIDYNLVVNEATEEAVIYDEEIKTLNNEIQIDVLNENVLSISIPKQVIKNFQITDTYPATCLSDNTSMNFEQFGNGVLIENQDNATGCFNYYSDIDQKHGYLLNIKQHNINGRSFFFYILDATKRQTVLEERLQNENSYFIIHPKYEFGRGYTFTFHNNSYSNIPSSNVLEEMTLFYVPYEQIHYLHFIINNAQLNRSIVNPNIATNKRSYYSYQAHIGSPHNNENLILYQAYHSGWVAYAFNKEPSHIIKELPFLSRDTKILNHFSVNNWANGWTTEKEYPYIIILFWPQYLQYIGFGLLLITFFVLFLPGKKSSS